MAAARLGLMRTFALSLRELWAEKLLVCLAVGAILILFSGGCGHSTSPQDSSRPLFPVPIGGSTGFINDLGKVVIAARFEAAQPFSEGLAAVKHTGRWGYIDRSGREVIEYLYRTAGSFHDGMAV